MTPDTQQQEHCICEHVCYMHDDNGAPCPNVLTCTDRPRPQTLYKTQVDDDGAVGKVAICLCDQCKVNGFLCQKSPRAISPHPPAPDADCDTCLFSAQCRVIPYIPPCYNHGPDSPARAARSATLAAFEEIQHYRKQNNAVYGDATAFSNEGIYLKERIESLRQSTTGDEQR